MSEEYDDAWFKLMSKKWFRNLCLAVGGSKIVKEKVGKKSPYNKL